MKPFEGRIGDRAVTITYNTSRPSVNILVISTKGVREFELSKLTCSLPPDPKRESVLVRALQDSVHPNKVGMLALPFEILFFGIAGWGDRLSKVEGKNLSSKVEKLLRENPEMDEVRNAWKKCRDRLVNQLKASWQERPTNIVTLRNEEDHDHWTDR